MHEAVPARAEPSLFAPLFAKGRRSAFAALLATASAETLAQVASAEVLRAAIDGQIAGTASAAGLVAVFGGLGAAFWLRAVIGEWIGQSYVNDVRIGLSRQAIQSALGRGRLGTISVRMSADLTALKNWADFGVCGGFSGGMTLGAGVWAGYSVLGTAGILPVLAGPALTAGIAACLTLPLMHAIRLRRRARGLLSARTGDSILAARAAAVYAAYERFTGPIGRTGRRLAKASVRQHAIVQFLTASALLALPIGVAVMLLSGIGAATTAPAWAGMLFAIGLAASGTARLVTAFEAGLEYLIASRKLRELAREATEAPAAAPAGTLRMRPRQGGALAIDGAEIIGAGNCRRMARDDALGWLDRVRFGRAGVTLDGVAADHVSAQDWGRRVALVSPDLPLPRGLLPDVLAARRRPSEKQIARYLALAGLDAVRDGLAGLIDPQKSPLGEPVLARLRLTRAIIHRPSLLLIDDAWVSSDSGLVERLSSWCREQGVSLLVLDPAWA